MLVKIHNSYRQIVAICDSDLVGQKFEQDERQLDVRESFYNGQEYAEKELIALMQDMYKEDATFNIVGQDSINCALKAGIIDRHGVLKTAGIPYAMVLM